VTARFILHLHAIDMPLSQEGDDKPVLVSVCKTVNGPNGCIPSLMRLYLINHKREESRAGSVYVSLSKIPLKFWGGFENREFSFVSDEGRNEPFDSLQPCVVQSAVEVMDGISDHERQIVEESGVYSVYKALCSMFRVNLSNSGIISSLDNGWRR
jgi:hypothetical protein